MYNQPPIGYFLMTRTDGIVVAVFFLGVLLLAVAYLGGSIVSCPTPFDFAFTKKCCYYGTLLNEI